MAQNAPFRALSACVCAAVAMAGFNYTSCMPSGVTSVSYAVGEQAIVCVHLNGAATAVVTPRVDSFSSLRLSGSNLAVPGNAGFLQQSVGRVGTVNVSDMNCSQASTQPRSFHITVDVSIGSVHNAVPRIYKTLTYSRVPGASSCALSIDTVSVLTAVIGLSQGAPAFIAWDDGCTFCAENGADCVPNGLDTATYSPTSDSGMRACRSSFTVCYGSLAGGNASLAANSTAVNATSASACDLKLFFAWIGTDSRGQYLRSAGQRFSRYRQFGTATLQQSTFNLAMDGLNVAQSSVNYAVSIPGRMSGNNDEIVGMG